MSDPHIADTKPAVVELEPGTYYWCACGLSGKQPFCDGSHIRAGMMPTPFEIVNKKTVPLCNCKHTKNPPYCDGSHKSLPPKV